MVNFCKKHIKKIIIIVSAILVISLLPSIRAKADQERSIALSTYDISIKVGSSATFNIIPIGVTGRVNISADGPVSVSSSSEWIEGGSASITVYGNSVGSGYVYVVPVNVGASDGSGQLTNELPELTLKVSVYNSQNNNNYSDDDYDDYYEGEGVDVEDNKFDVTIDEKEYTIVTDLSEVTLPKGFTKVDGTYGVETVNVAKYVSKDNEEIILYALSPKGDEKGDIIFMTFNSDKAEFKEPKTIKQGSNIYYLLNIPSSFKLPENYEIKEKALDETISANVIVEKNNSNSEFVYIYALADGEEGYYSYDIKEGTIQRCPDLEGRISPKVEVVETKNPVNKTMVIIIGVAILAVLAMGIILIVVLVKRKKEKNDKEEDDYYQAYNSYEYDDTPDEDETEKSDEIDELDVIDLSEDNEGLEEIKSIMSKDLEEDDGLDLIDLSKKTKDSE